jgi:outer membrane protein assembly factor BamB
MKPLSLSVFSLVVAAVTMAGESPAPSGSEWPAYRGGAGHTGVSPDESIKPPLKLLWSYRCDSDTSGDACAGVVVAGRKVFAKMDMTKSVIALDADAGRFLWEYSHRDMDPHETPTYADGRLYVWVNGLGRSTLAALDATTGKEAWTRQLKSMKGISAGRAGALVLSGKVIVPDSEEAGPVIVALDAATGNEAWRKPLGTNAGDNVVAPSAGGGLIFTGTYVGFAKGRDVHGRLMALDPGDGREVWAVTNAYSHSPVVTDGEILVCKINREIGQGALPSQKMYVLEAKTGKELWSSPINTLWGSETITRDLVIETHYGAGLTAHDRKTGKKLWSMATNAGSGCPSPTISGPYAYLGNGSFNDSEGTWAWRFVEPPHLQKGKTGCSWTLHGIDLRTAQSVWQYLTGCNVCGEPAIAYGRLYFNSRDGRVYCMVPAKEGEAVEPESPDKAPNAPPDEVKKLLAEALPAPVPGRDWPMAGGTPARTGLDVTLAPPLEPAWKLDTGGRVITAAAVVGGRVFVGSLSGKILAADLKTGAKLWELDTGAPVQCSPAAAGDAVYVGSDSAKFHALGAADGKPIWTYATGGPVQASPAVVGGMVIFGANDHNLYALNRKTGKKLWAFRTGYLLVQAPPVVAGDQIFAGQWVDWLYALDLATGKEQWRNCIPISIEALAFYRDKLWLRTPRQFAEFDPKTGKRLRIADACYGYNGMAFMKHLAVVSGTGFAGYVDLDKTGEKVKNVPNMEDVGTLGGGPFGGWPSLTSMGTPLVLGENVCLATKAGEVLITKPDFANPQRGVVLHKQLWSAKLGGTCHATPVAADGHLIVGCDDGFLYAFREKTPSPGK